MQITIISLDTRFGSYQRFLVRDYHQLIPVQQFNLFLLPLLQGMFLLRKFTGMTAVYQPERLGDKILKVTF